MDLPKHAVVRKSGIYLDGVKLDLPIERDSISASQNGPFTMLTLTILVNGRVEFDWKSEEGGD